MKLPHVIPSSLGPVPVIDKPGDNASGSFEPRTRVIRLDASCTDVLLLSTLGHEIAHLALYDAGTANLLSSRITEAVCDAMGLWFATAVMSGFVRVDANWKPRK